MEDGLATPPPIMNHLPLGKYLIYLRDSGKDSDWLTNQAES